MVGLNVQMGRHQLQHRAEFPGQDMLLIRFGNGYGASVVRHRGSKGGTRGLWELAVVVPPEDGSYAFDLCYTTAITDDVVGSLTEDEVGELLDRIEALPNSGEAWT